MEKLTDREKQEMREMLLRITKGKITKGKITKGKITKGKENPTGKIA